MNNYYKKQEGPHAVLKLYVNKDFVELRKLYADHVEKHNESMKNDEFPNSGFDIFVPSNTLFDAPIKTFMINHQIKAEMIYFDDNSGKSYNCGYYIYPRSSISKTNLMLSNHTGIIDSGYRGYIMGAFRLFGSFEPHTMGYTVDKHTRLLQICHPSLCPIFVQLVEEDELSSTVRGDGGFGSTGLVGVNSTK